MKAKQHKKEPRLEIHEIAEHVEKRLKPYDKLSFLEQFAMFIGRVQILELGLKQLLSRLYKYDLDEMETWTLGRTTNELEKNGLRADFIALLRSVVEHRNYIAHELLANQAIMSSLSGGDGGTFEARRLSKGIYELEQIIFLHDWTEEHGGWK